MKNEDHEFILNSFSTTYSLTPRETEIVGQLLLQITSTRQISESLGISTSTVRNHFENIFRKTHCENKCEVAVLLYKQLLSKVNSFKSFGRAPKVIVVDDNKVICDLLVSSLEKYGIKVVGVTEPEKVVDLLKVDRYDCVISDIRMPTMDGVELLEQIRTSHPLWPFVILISGHHDYNTEELLNYGAVDFVNKPFKVDEIYNLISNYYIDDLVERNRSMLMDKEIHYDFNDSIIDLNIVSIGTGGVYISYKSNPELRNAEVGKIYDFTVQIGEGESYINVAGEVVWSRGEEEEEENPGVGIRFLSMTEKVDSFIKSYISKNKVQSFIPNR